LAEGSLTSEHQEVGTPQMKRGGTREGFRP
jgi:hypothetical protein